MKHARGLMRQGRRSGWERLCPYCQQILPEWRLQVQLTPTQAKIYDLIMKSGDYGMPTEVLTERLGLTACTLKTHIHHINERIADSGYRLRGHSNIGYRLIKRCLSA
jgi:hypothetical protein